MPHLSKWLSASLCLLALSVPISRAQSDSGSLFPDVKDAQKTDTPTNNPQIPPPPPAPSVPPVLSPASSPPQIAPAPQKKIPIPNAAAQKAAIDLVNEAYRDDITKATTPQQQTELAKKLLQAGIETNDPAGRFVLFTKAKDIATLSGSMDIALNAIDEMDKAYNVDAPRLKANTLEAVTKTTRSPEYLAGLVEKCKQLIDATMQVDRYDLAKEVADLALAIARRTDDSTLIRRSTQRTKDVDACAAAFSKLKSSLVTLTQKPSDPDANLAVGRFRCFFKDDWDGGLPMLAIGSDVTLKALAAKDVAGTTLADEQEKMGDGWWAVAETETGLVKDYVRRHAGKRYSAALPNLSGLDKAKVEARIKLIPLVVNRQESWLSKDATYIASSNHRRRPPLPSLLTGEGKFYQGGPPGFENDDAYAFQTNEMKDVKKGERITGEHIIIDLKLIGEVTRIEVANRAFHQSGENYQFILNRAIGMRIWLSNDPKERGLEIWTAKSGEDEYRVQVPNVRARYVTIGFPEDIVGVLHLKTVKIFGYDNPENNEIVGKGNQLKSQAVTYLWSNGTKVTFSPDGQVTTSSSRNGTWRKEGDEMLIFWGGDKSGSPERLKLVDDGAKLVSKKFGTHVRMVGDN